MIERVNGRWILDMMGSILGNNISNEIYFVYGLIAVVLILIVVILVMDHQAKRRLHKNLFNNKVLRKNLKHLEETGELPVVAPKKKEEKPFIPITKVEPIVLKSSKSRIRRWILSILQRVFKSQFNQLKRNLSFLLLLHQKFLFL